VSLFLYNIFLICYRLAARLMAAFQPKARQWVEGRREWRQRVAAAMQTSKGRKKLWIHCASLGEFEQARPLLETLKKQYPGVAVVLTFFSPSGYELRKNYAQAEHVFYLPMDGKSNAEDFLDLVRPDLAVFVKYEFWYYYLHALHRRGVPVILICAAFRSSQPFFRWYGGMFRRLLKHYSLIFVHSETSARLLEDIGIRGNVIVAGDTRYDRVAEIAAGAKSFPLIEMFRGGGELVIGGSTWPDDERLLHGGLEVLPENWKMVLAPHEITPAHIRGLQQRFGEDAVLYSELQDQPQDAARKKVLIIDNMGMLSALYRYGAIAYVGGGFQKGGIHNILEAAVYGLPVLFGPNYRKFVEAANMVVREYAFPVENTTACKAVLQRLSSDLVLRRQLRTTIGRYMQQQRGAVRRIMSEITERHWLA
jgi:3-deoxy-D-manno-octulosonic-acid transferase